MCGLLLSDATVSRQGSVEVFRTTPTMRAIRYIGAALMFGCASGASAPASSPPPVTTQAHAAQDEPAGPAVPAQQVVEPPAEQPCGDLIGNAAIEQWRAQLIAAVSQRDDKRTLSVLRCVDPDFSHPLFDQVEEWLAVANPAQLDDDKDEEWVLELRQHTPITGDGERFDLVWVAALDWVDGRYETAGVISRAKLHACMMADEEALAVDFDSNPANGGPALIVTEQHTKSCGAKVEVSYSRTRHRVVDGKLVSEPLEAPASKSYKR